MPKLDHQAEVSMAYRFIYDKTHIDQLIPNIFSPTKRKRHKKFKQSDLESSCEKSKYFDRTRSREDHPMQVEDFQ